MKSKYEVLVVGGGPAGALAARTAAEKGLSVCLVEKRPAIGAPVRCAEGIGKEALAEFIASRSTLDLRRDDRCGHCCTRWF